MALDAPRPGVGSVPEYLVPGIPWITGSLVITDIRKVKFPNVSKFFVVSNTGAADISVGFTPAGVAGDHGFTIANGTSQTFDLKVREIFLSGSGDTVDILAGLTGIPRDFYLPLTGANPAPEGTWFVPGIE